MPHLVIYLLQKRLESCEGERDPPLSPLFLFKLETIKVNCTRYRILVSTVALIWTKRTSVKLRIGGKGGERGERRIAGVQARASTFSLEIYEASARALAFPG